MIKFPMPSPWVPTKYGPRKLYLAFGSNLHIQAMRQRCPDAYPELNKKGRPAKYMLDNARLVFRGVADLDWCPGERVPVGLWWISARDEAALDRYEGYRGEGHPDNYYEKFHIWLDPLKRDRQGMVYAMTDRDGIFPPSLYYANVVRTGYADFGMPLSYLNAAIEHSFLDKNPSPQTIARRARQKKNSQHAKLIPLPERVHIALMEAARDRAERERQAAQAQPRTLIDSNTEELDA
jgi:hypothetical protein